MAVCRLGKKKKPGLRGRGGVDAEVRDEKKILIMKR